MIEDVGGFGDVEGGSKDICFTQRLMSKSAFAEIRDGGVDDT